MMMLYHIIYVRKEKKRGVGQKRVNPNPNSKFQKDSTLSLPYYMEEKDKMLELVELCSVPVPVPVPVPVHHLEFASLALAPGI